MVTYTNAMFDALSDSARRTLLFDLLENSPQSDSLPDECVSDRSARIDYEHLHLPKLDSMGYIEWTRDVNAVEQGDNFDEIAPLLRLLDTERRVLYP